MKPSHLVVAVLHCVDDGDDDDDWLLTFKSTTCELFGNTKYLCTL